MTVIQLIERLAKCNPNAMVKCNSPATEDGDMVWGTIVSITTPEPPKSANIKLRPQDKEVFLGIAY